eukprot:SAG31_NODE_35125_length_326_cov_0.674009_1_plen_52_part_10
MRHGTAAGRSIHFCYISLLAYAVLVRVAARAGARVSGRILIRDACYIKININ